MINKREIFTLGGLNLVDEIVEIYKTKDKIKVLDVGCGNGYTVNYLCENGFDAMGIDYCEEIINMGREEYNDINIKVMDANNLDFPEGYFNVILFECSLSIMKNPKNILIDCKRLLKEKGIILISDFFFKEIDMKDDTYSLNYWKNLFYDSNFETIVFKDKSKEWKSYLGMILWEYGDLSGLLRGSQNNKINNNILKRETGYFFIILKKRD